MQDQNCIFCKIAQGEAPAYKVYEDDEFVAFLDIFPVTRGHVQVIPKEHYRWVWDVPNMGNYFELVRKVASAMKKGFGIEYVQLYVAGDEVAHAHVWVIPATEGGRIHKEGGYEFRQEEAQELVDAIKNSIE